MTPEGVYLGRAGRRLRNVPKTTCIECQQEKCSCSETSQESKSRKLRRDHFLVRRKASPSLPNGVYFCDGCENCQYHCECGPSGTPSPCDLKLAGHCRKCNAVQTQVTNEVRASPSDPANPPHYRVGIIEPITVIEDWKLNYCLGSALKYIARCGHKAGARPEDDLRKAVWFLERELRLSAPQR